MVRAQTVGYKYGPPPPIILHTYLDDTDPFRDLGSWAVGTFHSTATLSPEGACGLYVLRCMHRLNIFLFRLGHSGWAGLIFMPRRRSNPNPILLLNKTNSMIVAITFCIQFSYKLSKLPKWCISRYVWHTNEVFLEQKSYKSSRHASFSTHKRCFCCDTSIAFTIELRYTVMYHE